MATGKTTKRRTIKATRDYVSSLKFFMLPQDGGQIVAITYAVDEDGLWCRIFDQCDRSESFQFACYSARATESQREFSPQNGKLPAHNQWVDVCVS